MFTALFLLNFIYLFFILLVVGSFSTVKRLHLISCVCVFIASTGISKKGDEEQKIVTIISIFHQTPAASSKFITQLCQLILQTEQAMLIEASSPFREVLMKFLLRYPLETLDMFLDDNFVKEKQYNRYLEYLLKHKEGKVFKDQLIQQRMKRVITMSMAVLDPSHAHVNLSLAHRNQMQFQAIKIVTALAKEDDSWLNQHTDLLAAFRRIWCDDVYHERHKNVEDMEYAHWREPKLLAKILLKFFVHFPKDIDLLFQLLRAFTERFIPEFQVRIVKKLVLLRCYCSFVGCSF